MYAKLTSLLKNIFSVEDIYKYGFNWSPMYRRSVGKITNVSKGLYEVNVKIPLNYKNRNYAGTIFGGSLFSATDPIYMIQLIQILGNDYIVWDKHAEIRYKRPAKSDAYANFIFSNEEVDRIKSEVAEKGEVNWIKKLDITNHDATIIFAHLVKTIYVADKSFYAEKRKK